MNDVRVMEFGFGKNGKVISRLRKKIVFAPREVKERGNYLVRDLVDRGNYMTCSIVARVKYVRAAEGQEFRALTERAFKENGAYRSNLWVDSQTFAEYIGGGAMGDQYNLYQVV